jgi:hypothetical protein
MNMAPTTDSASQSQALQLKMKIKKTRGIVEGAANFAIRARHGVTIILICWKNWERGHKTQSHIISKGHNKIDGSIYTINIIDCNCNRKYAD